MNRGSTFKSTPCKNCNGVERYQSNGNCPSCQSESNKRYKMRKSLETGKAYKPRPVPYNPNNKNAANSERLLEGVAKILFGLFTVSRNKNQQNT